MHGCDLHITQLGDWFCKELFSKKIFSTFIAPLAFYIVRDSGFEWIATFAQVTKIQEVLFFGAIKI